MGQSAISACWCKLIQTPKPARPSRLNRVGTWLSLVEHSLGVRGVGSSNLPVPTIVFNAHPVHCPCPRARLGSRIDPRIPPNLLPETKPPLQAPSILGW